MCFDKVIEEYFGIFFGTDTCIFIKTGRGGTVYGKDNKYLRIAKTIYDKTGYTIVVSANPVEYECDLELEIDYLKNLPEIKNIVHIYYVGISNGAIIGATQGFHIKEIQRMLLINGPLMINYHKTVKGIRQFDGNEVVLVYGANDPSYMYTVWLENEKFENVSVKIIEKADHTFKGMAKEFMGLIVDYVVGGII